MPQVERIADSAVDGDREPKASRLLDRHVAGDVNGARDSLATIGDLAPWPARDDHLAFPCNRSR